MSIRTEKQITKEEAKERVINLIPGEVVSFSSKELGYKYPGFSVLVGKNERGGRYTMSQCGDWLGDDNTAEDVANFIANRA
mgnify:CR=1 FL=1